MNKPLFSIVIPAYNREHTLGRAIDSVLSQDFSDHEIIVVDDASTDRTRAVAEAYCIRAPVRVISHEVNRGIGATRNTGIRAACGEWIVPLDSDDELSPKILLELQQMISTLDPQIMRIRGMVRMDNGQVSPVPHLKDEVWGYERYIKSLNVPSGLPVESASIFRREALLQIPYQQGRTLEALFHLDFFAHFPVRCTSLIIRLYHAGAGNTTRDVKPLTSILRDEPDWAAMTDELLARHGAALLQWAPIMYYGIVHHGVKHHLICGNRRRALNLFWIGLKRPRVRLFAYFLLGVIHPVLLGWASRLPAIVRGRVGR